jgi:hypothetical protein
VNYFENPNAKSPDSLNDRIDNTAGKALETLGSVAFWGMQAGHLIGRQIKEVRQKAETGARLSEEVALSVAYLGASKALGLSKKIFDRESNNGDGAPLEVDGLEVPHDQLSGLEVLKDEDRVAVLNTVGGSVAYSVAQQYRRIGGTPEQAKQRVERLAEEHADLDKGRASHLTALPDPQRALEVLET